MLIPVFLFVILTTGAYAQELQDGDTLRHDTVSYGRYGKPYRYLLTNPVGFDGPVGEKKDPEVTEVRIGVFGPSKGKRAPCGTSLLRGAQMAVEEANLQGGYRGKPFTLVFRPDDGPWGTAARQMVRLIYEDRVWAVLGGVDGPNTHIAEQVVTRLWVPLVTPTATDPALTQTNVPWIFRCIPDDEQQARALAGCIFLRRGYTEVAGVAVNDHYGRSGMGEFERLASRMGSPLALSLKYNPGDGDFRRQLSLLEQSGVQVVVIWGAPEESAMFLRQMRERGMDPVVFGSTGLAVPEFLEAAGRFAEGVIVTLPYDADRCDTTALVFREHFRARYGQGPDLFAAYAYDGARIVVEAVRSAGLSRVRIRDAITAMTDFHGVTGTIGFDKTGRNMAASVRLAVIRRGRFLPLE
jgi:ABC-type branched-subunit amino acid transport system substrate-binding protein